MESSGQTLLGIWNNRMKTTEKKVITWLLGLTYTPCMDTYTNIEAENKEHSRQHHNYIQYDFCGS